MKQASRADSHPPDLGVEGIECRATDHPGRWIGVWRIHNRGDSSAEIAAVWLPHDRFFSDNQEYGPPLALESLGLVDLAVPVDCRETPGSVIDNAFVILRVAYHRREWRVFARQEVRIDKNGVPQAICLSVTCQPAGNSDPGSPECHCPR